MRAEQLIQSRLCPGTRSFGSVGGLEKGTIVDRQHVGDIIMSNL